MTFLKRKRSMFIILVSLILTIGMLLYGLSVFDELENLRASETALFSRSRNLNQNFRELQRALGFGGYIHNVKEYLLHRDPNQLLILQANIREIEDSYSALKKHFLNIPRSARAIKTLDEFISSIKHQYQLLSAPENQQLDPAALDRLLATEDPTTLSAIVTLESLENTYTKTAIVLTKSSIDVLRTRLVLSSVLLPLTLVTGCFLAWLLNHALRAKQELESAKQFLLEKDQWFEETSRIAKVGGWEVDAETSKVYWTEETYRIHGLPPGQVPTLERALSEYPPEAREILAQAIAEAREEGHPFDLELPLTNAAGNELFVRAICNPIIKNGKTTKMRGSFQDITDRKLAEIRLREAQKMEVVGRMAGGIAHNVNNSLAAIMGNIELVKLKLPQGHEAARQLDNSLAAAEKTRDLVRKILAFSPQNLYRKTPVRITNLFAEITEMIKSAIPGTINLKCDTAPETEGINIHADVSQLKDVMIDLYNNAVYAMEGKGDLTLSMGIAELQHEDIPAPYECPSGSYARIGIEDTGCGMSSETMEKIFDPFFTTKDVGQGTGLGLSTAQGIIEKHGGFITVKSVPEQGTRVRLFFPVVYGNDFQGMPGYS